MSHIKIYKITNDGEFQEHAQVKNSHAGKPFIWITLTKLYNLKGDMLISFKELWHAAQNYQMSWEHCVLVCSTFDGSWIQKNHILEVANAWESFYCKYGLGTTTSPATHQVAKILRELSKHPEIIGASFLMTSIIESPWVTYSEDADEEVSYNLGVGTIHHELYDALDDNLSNIVTASPKDNQI